jgi:DNA mismatch endonuclease (patch repair protein)
MQAVRSTDTKPELLVRGIAHRLGYRFRLHRKDLPGKPDLVFVGRRKIVFVHGCFWHGHNCARGARVPRTNRAYWLKKIRRNRQRHVKAESELRLLGWRVLVLWECELKEPAAVRGALAAFLETKRNKQKKHD